MNSPGTPSPREGAGEIIYNTSGATLAYKDIYPRKLQEENTQAMDTLDIQQTTRTDEDIVIDPLLEDLEDDLYNMKKIREQKGYNTDTDADTPLSDEDLTPAKGKRKQKFFFLFPSLIDNF